MIEHSAKEFINLDIIKGVHILIMDEKPASINVYHNLSELLKENEVIVTTLDGFYD